MALKIKIGDQETEVEEDVQTNEPVPITLDIRKTVDGNLMIFDHPEIDISILPASQKIVVFPKERISEKVYDMQDRFFKFLFEKGVIKQNSIQGGSVYGSMEASYPASDKVNMVPMLILVIERFIKQEKKFVEYDEEIEEEFERRLTEPDKDESTALGDVSQSSQKGSIRPGYIYSPYGISAIYRYEE